MSARRFFFLQNFQVQGFFTKFSVCRVCSWRERGLFPPGCRTALRRFPPLARLRTRPGSRQDRLHQLLLLLTTAATQAAGHNSCHARRQLLLLQKNSWFFLEDQQQLASTAAILQKHTCIFRAFLRILCSSVVPKKTIGYFLRLMEKINGQKLILIQIFN